MDTDKRRNARRSEAGTLPTPGGVPDWKDVEVDRRMRTGLL